MHVYLLTLLRKKHVQYQRKQKSKQTHVTLRSRLLKGTYYTSLPGTYSVNVFLKPQHCRRKRVQVWRNFTLRGYAIVAQNNVCVHALQQHQFTTLIATPATSVVVYCHVNVLHRTVGQERLAGGVKVKDRCQQSSLKSKQLTWKAGQSYASSAFGRVITE